LNDCVQRPVTKALGTANPAFLISASFASRGYVTAMVKMLIVALVLLAGGVVAVRQLEYRTAPSAMATAPAPVSAAPSARNLVLSKGRNGHFEVEARVDGRRLGFLVDTGASVIALRESDARRVGIYPRQSDYTVMVNTANGVTKAAWAELRTVEVGDIVVRNVRALVQPDSALGVNLLGMSFLSRVRWTHERGKLVLEQ
jgi:aspartyl protease family protein